MWDSSRLWFSNMGGTLKRSIELQKARKKPLEMPDFPCWQGQGLDSADSVTAGRDKRADGAIVPRTSIECYGFTISTKWNGAGKSVAQIVCLDNPPGIEFSGKIWRFCWQFDGADNLGLSENGADLNFHRLLTIFLFCLPLCSDLPITIAPQNEHDFDKKRFS